MSVTALGAGPRLCALLGSLAEIATAGVAAAMPTLITAIRGPFKAPPLVVGQWSASLPRAAFASQAPPSCGDPMDFGSRRASFARVCPKAWPRRFRFVSGAGVPIHSGGGPVMGSRGPLVAVSRTPLTDWSIGDRSSDRLTERQ